MKKALKTIDIFLIWIRVMALWTYVYDETHQIEYIKHVSAFVYQSYFNEAVFERSINMVK
jgi:hypothetical protein